MLSFGSLANLLPVPLAGSYEHLEKITKRLIDGILAAGREAGHDVCGGNISGMFGFFFCKGPVIKHLGR